MASLLLSAVGVGAYAQPAPTDAPRLIAPFVDARAVAVDPAGVVYVVEGAREAIVTLRNHLPDERRLGGRGSEAGQFDGLADIDPTNGLVLVVADAGNGRIQRFSREFLFLESLPVDRREAGAEAGGYTSYRKQEQGGSSGQGRPIAVRTSHAEETFVVDVDRHVVLKWDRERNFEREIGGYDAGDGALIEPVALALDQAQRTLFVLDIGRGAVMVYDFLGGFERLMALDPAGDAIGLEVWGEELMVFEQDRVVRYHARGHREAEYAVDLGEPIVDMAWSAAGVYALTKRALYRLDLH